MYAIQIIRNIFDDLGYSAVQSVCDPTFQKAMILFITTHVITSISTKFKFSNDLNKHL
jgi:hypothetical protein